MLAKIVCCCFVLAAAAAAPASVRPFLKADPVWVEGWED